MERSLGLPDFYHNKEIILTTKHNKAFAIAAAFKKNLSANVVEFSFDTDILGTFSG